MSDETRDDPVSDPATSQQIDRIGSGLLVLTLLLLYLLITSWPVLIEFELVDKAGNVIKDANGQAKTLKKFDEFNLFGVWCDWAADKRVLFIVAVAGALGAMAPVLTSIATFVGNRRFSMNWMWWYVLRAPIGIALAMLFYFIIRGGLLLPTVPTNANTLTQDVTLALNIYGIAAFSALAGMFSKQATDKLEEVFTAVFTRREPVKRNDPATGQSLTFNPRQLKKGTAENLTVTGIRFKKGASQASINGNPRALEVADDETKATLTVKPEDVVQAGKLKITVVIDGKQFNAEINVVD